MNIKKTKKNHLEKSTTNWRKKEGKIGWGRTPIDKKHY
jgi:hypothetical protein